MSKLISFIELGFFDYIVLHFIWLKEKNRPKLIFLPIEFAITQNQICHCRSIYYHVWEFVTKMNECFPSKETQKYFLGFNVMNQIKWDDDIDAKGILELKSCLISTKCIYRKAMILFHLSNTPIAKNRFKK